MNIILIVVVALLVLIYKLLDMYFKRLYNYHIKHGTFIEAKSTELFVKKVLIFLIILLIGILIFRIIV